MAQAALVSMATETSTFTGLGTEQAAMSVPMYTMVHGLFLNRKRWLLVNTPLDTMI